jgi:HD-GYP domain-containing protein (c-di-GMP phosphodiesterase class II)
VQIESNALIHIQAPIMNESGDVIAQIRGLYLLSEKTRASLQRDIISGALFSFAIVLLTTLALYPVILLLVRRLGRLTESLLHSNLEMLQVIGSAIAKRDSDTDAHNYRVCLYSVQLARELDLPRSELRRLLKGAFLHDVGKIGISDQILHKPGPLDAEETKLMRQHVPLGLDIICRSHWLADASEVVGSHHERLDGNGYPQGLIGEDIPLLARIFAIADVFDALCSVRPYKKAFPLEIALDIMRQASGKHFDQKLLTVFEGLAGSLHARYYGRKIEELREELGAILDAAFSDKLSQLTKFYEKS